MYNVIIVHDDTRDKNYYYSYVEESGNIECEDLPSYQDTNKARACYWNTENATWVYDADKYAEIVKIQATEKAAAEQIRLEAKSVPSNAELAEAIIEIASSISDMIDAIAELGAMVSVKEGGEA